METKAPLFWKKHGLNCLLFYSSEFTRQLGLRSAGAFKQVSSFHAHIKPHWYHLPVTITAKWYIYTLSTGRVIWRKATSAPVIQD